MNEHEAVQANAAELALGVLSGSERADTLAHLETCHACRALVEDLSDVADGLLLVAPEAEPPAGFESAVLARVGERTPLRRRRWMLAGAAAATALVLAVGGFALGRQRQGSRLDREYADALKELGGQALAAATLVDAQGSRAGQLFLYQGRTSWVFVTVADPGAAGTYAVEFLWADGHRSQVRGLVVHDGRGSLGATTTLRLRDLRGVTLVDAGGRPAYRGRFHADHTQ
jgi:hypothetical protein